jgi:hypothetical protein
VKNSKNDMLLYEATMDEIVDELERRHQAFLVVVEKKSESNPRDNSTSTYWHGGTNAALGMAERARAQFVDDILKQHVKVEGD